jgi:hypothetical protein
MNNPNGLNISNQITLEAWIKPSATQGDPAIILSHGPQTLSDFLGTSPDGAVTNTAQVFMRIDGAAAYVIGSAAFTNGLGTSYYYVSSPIPGGDMGGANWIHLVGTYDGAMWRLFRNGAQAASATAALGALPVNTGDWAIGSIGNGWTNAFNGLIDEVAIYNYALSTNQIRSHYNAGVSQPRLTITRSGSNVIVTWPYGPLYQADNANGPYTLVPGNPSSPYTVAASAAKKFYRF